MDDRISRYLESISSEVHIQIEQEFPNDADRNQAEISLRVCSMLLKAHLTERAKYGYDPTS